MRDSLSEVNGMTSHCDTSANLMIQHIHLKCAFLKHSSLCFLHTLKKEETQTLKSPLLCENQLLSDDAAKLKTLCEVT